MAQANPRNRKGSPAARKIRPRLLVYGFGPYDGFRSNITERALQTLAPVPGVKKIVFPVRFEESRFIAAIRKHRPDIVLGLGQCSAGARFRIEGRAANRKCGRRARAVAPIHARRPRWLKTTLPIEQRGAARASRDAGTYVCNFSMYVILDYARTHRLPLRFGFVHVPRSMRLSAVADYLRKMVARVQGATSGRGRGASST